MFSQKNGVGVIDLKRKVKQDSDIHMIPPCIMFVFFGVVFQLESKSQPISRDPMYMEMHKTTLAKKVTAFCPLCEIVAQFPSKYINNANLIVDTSHQSHCIPRA
jgi:hypothetical protein